MNDASNSAGAPGAPGVDERQELFERAFTAHQSGRLSEAREFYQALRVLDPSHYDAAYLLGVSLYQSGLLHEALSELSDATELSPNNPLAHLAMGSVLKSLNRHNEALQSYDKAIELSPQFAEAYNNRGNTLRALGRLDDAATSYRQAITFNPGYADAHNNLGIALNDSGDYLGALSSYDAAIKLRSDSPNYYLNRGTTLRHLNRLQEAVGDFDRGLLLDPKNADILNAKAATLSDLGQTDVSLECYNFALSYAPAHIHALHNRGLLLHRMGKVEQANRDFQDALKLDPTFEYLEGLALHTSLKLCDWSEIDAKRRHLFGGVVSGKKVSPPFPMLGLVDDPALHQICASTYSSDKHPVASVLPPITASSRDRERIRVGYFSADFRNHPVAYLIAELFELHDRSTFELFGFSYGVSTEDDMRRRIPRSFAEFYDINNLDDKQVAELARERQLDIAVDLTGYTQSYRTSMFAYRCAPVQVNYLGYPGTLGTDYFDYIVADHTVIPQGSEQYFSENIIFMPHCYQANDRKRLISDRHFSRKECGLPEGAFVFCCFNNNWKIMPETFDIWASILRKVEGSVIWLLEDNPSSSHNLRKQMALRGLNPDRLVFAGRLPTDQHLARHRCADLFLDTHPYNAHTTASDALWAGLPVLTLEGRSFPARVAASLLTAIGLPELIAHTSEEYEAAAVALAEDATVLVSLKNRLERNRLTFPLFNTSLFTRCLEAAFLEIVRRSDRQLSPCHIDVSEAACATSLSP